MGRQAFITRLTLGRSALEPVDPQSLQDKEETLPAETHLEPKSPNDDTVDRQGSNVAVLSTENSIIGRSFDYQQQYDAKGYPENLDSKKANRRWRHAVNDVLAIVGSRLSKGDVPIQSSEVQDSRLVDEVRLINSHGLRLGGVDQLLRFVSEPWTTSFRQRFQTFRFYADVPLIEIIKSEWKLFGGLQFLFAGRLSLLVFCSLDYGIERLTEYIFGALRNATTGQLETGTRWQRLGDAALNFAERLTDFSFFALIAPLEFYCTLRNLDLLPPMTIVTNFRAYKSTLAAILTSKQSFGCLSPFAFLFLVYTSYRHNRNLNSKIFQYVWAALPKPTCPDGLSMLAAQKDRFDMSDIAGLVDKNTPKEEQVSTSVVDQLARDLQKLGKCWQIFYDRGVELLKVAFQLNSSDPESPPRIQRSIAPVNLGETDENQSSPHDIPNRNTPNSAPASPSHLLNHGQPIHPSPDSSVPPSPASTAGFIELTHHNEDGYTYVNLSISQPPTDPPGTPPEGVERRTSSTSFFRDIVDQHDDNLSPDHDQLREDDEDLVIVEVIGENSDSYEDDSSFEPDHRVTALSAYPAQSLAERLTDLLSDALYLPIEAFYVRALATAFLSSPARSSVEAAGRWKREVYPPWPWITPTGRAGGLRGAGNYLGKMILVLGLQAGVSYLTWQVGMGAVWWIGRRYNAWTKPTSEKRAQKSR